jgi:hypothetical protein
LDRQLHAANAAGELMSVHQGFRRQPVPPQVAQKHQAITIPAPAAGLTDSDNLAFMKPGTAVLLDNWVPTLRGVQLRGGFIRHCDLHALDAEVPPVPSPLRKPIISAFEYIDAASRRIFAAQQDKLFDVTSATPILVKDAQSSGNYVASQMANASGDHMLVANEAGDYLMHFDGLTWTTFDASQITAPTPPAPATPPTCTTGHNLTYVCKYRNRFFFIEGGTMNAWYLGIDSHQGALNLIPLAGAAARGGKLLFIAVWSGDTGDGVDDKLVFCTNLGELIVFTGSNPADPANWRQEGRFQIPVPMGMNAHINLGGDLLVATLDGIVPMSGAISKDAGQLDFAMISHAIRGMWRREALSKRFFPWTMKRWDEAGIMAVTWPGGNIGNRYCAVVNTATGAWCRFMGYDATCFMQLSYDLFFGTQDGIVMQCERTGYDDGKPYVCTMIGGWGMFGQQAQTKTWSQARAQFVARPGEPFVPQITAVTDYVINLPAAPHAGHDSGRADVWDQGLWDQMLWDAAGLPAATVRNTGWVSIGSTGFSHAPVVQVTMAQNAKPNVELIAIDGLYWTLGTNV